MNEALAQAGSCGEVFRKDNDEVYPDHAFSARGLRSGH